MDRRDNARCELPHEIAGNFEYVNNMRLFNSHCSLIFRARLRGVLIKKN